jgi:hypothetical protein
MNILIYGPSGTLGYGYGVAEGDRFPNLLSSLLAQHFPDEPIDLDVEAWGYFSKRRQRAIAADIERRKPDYLVLEATPVWVYLLSWTIWARRRLPSPFRRKVAKLDRLDSDIRQHLRPYPWLLNLYKRPVGLIGQHLGGAELPQYTVQGVVEVFSSLLKVAKRQEAMEIIVTDHAMVSAAHARAYPNAQAISEQLATALEAECRRQHIRFVDYGRVLRFVPPADLFMSDAIHFTVESKRREAEMLTNAIVHSERAFG